MTKRKAKTKKESSSALAVANKEHEIGAMFGEQDSFRVPTDAPLPQYEILRESQQFRNPSGEPVKQIEGHILYWHEANVFWSTPFGEGDTSLPDCSSSDGIQPDGGESPLAEPCRSCPKNEYGSALDGGRGKACQNMIRLYLILDCQRLPVVLKAPPSSLGKKESLIRWLTNSINEGTGGRYQTIRVRFSLHKKEFEKFSASVLDLITVRVLSPEDPDDMQQLKRLSKLYAEVQRYHQKRVAVDVASTERYSGEDDVPF